jgi:hypothetical protein
MRLVTRDVSFRPASFPVGLHHETRYEKIHTIVYFEKKIHFLYLNLFTSRGFTDRAITCNRQLLSSIPDKRTTVTAPSPEAWHLEARITGLLHTTLKLDVYSSVAPDPIFAFVGGTCCPSLDFVIAFWIMVTFYTLLTSLFCIFRLH